MSEEELLITSNEELLIYYQELLFTSNEELLLALRPSTPGIARRRTARGGAAGRQHGLASARATTPSTKSILLLLFISDGYSIIFIIIIYKYAITVRNK